VAQFGAAGLCQAFEAPSLDEMGSMRTSMEKRIVGKAPLIESGDRPTAIPNSATLAAQSSMVRLIEVEMLTLNTLVIMQSARCWVDGRRGDTVIQY
jgi:hypothetical protein